MSSREPLPEPLPHIGPVLDDRTRRQRFEPHELAIVLSHYDLGVVDQIRTYPRGSPRSPKVRITSRRGDFLLKRRAPGRDDPYRVAFTQSLQLYLCEQGYPVPRLIGTRQSNNSMLQLGGRIYEMFEYTTGTRYDGSALATELAGRALGTLHRLLEGYDSPYEPPRGTYHGVAGIDATLALIPAAVAAREPGADTRSLERTTQALRDAYHHAARQVDDAGFRTWPRRIIHGDWHPGNVLYSRRRGTAVTAVLDFDSSRIEPAIADVANAALQFSMRWNDGEDPAQSPADLDVDRIRRIVRGYGPAVGDTIGTDELAALPWLMTEALVLESIVPIAATGSFGRVSGSRFLRMVEGKVHWIAPRAEQLTRHIEG